MTEEDWGGRFLEVAVAIGSRVYAVMYIIMYAYQF